ncbi:MAG: hypothetical protein UX80_C0019G0003 [Candidatus Amesbacteria bacterium GW2011_GWA2_47_11b]|uniref:YcfA family protein n=3 Tax=Candidatus Amesiibacteriota TaxID=1752730 RepID=A0A0G1SI91_9BACT|nr:MAG: hypothetical protein UX42_C0003G0071 [Microgenomates group bacterium GW2011_GWC1_46_20]KKU57311.1 MAG: hypothetical protein UX80_C0019G0003 [Candidatus Amesbacteria bacterium GW2011_GWA2_47_11b]KKU69154.1 MAG: hypothetical protein UX92_C0014G0045 [Candidatus Amesbacteria bacterium GW2011_GWA1_47_20]KKU83421.1 MAG: hypothetical protein UY11_C0020G0003 [Candidatus Amesbacteria bacterium GW2011_GWC2_47_8]
MGKLSNIRTANAVKAFEEAGFVKISQVGSHIKMRRTTQESKVQTIIIPNHKTLKEGTLRNGILRPIFMTTKEFIDLLER